MLIDKTGKTITDLDFRGSKIEYLDKLTAKELFLIISTTLQTINKMERFTAKDVAPFPWDKTVYLPILAACGNDKKEASKMMSIVVKQALIMSPLPFHHAGGESQWDSAEYTRILLGI